MIKVYSPQNHSESKNWLHYLVHPIRAWWGDGTNDWKLHEDGFNFYKTLFELTDEIDEAELVFLPLTLNYYIKHNKLALVDKLISKSKLSSKPVFIWVDGDQQINYYRDGCYILKYSGYKSRGLQNEIILAADMKTDLLEEYFSGKLNILEKSEQPRIGFDGIAEYPFFKLSRLVLKNSMVFLKFKILNEIVEPDPIIPLLLRRKRLLNSLKFQEDICCNFNLRNSFALGTIGQSRLARIEYIENINSNDYTFCLRGAANYSLRFYETLCLGKIPLFIDSDCILPFEDKVNWKEVCLFIDEEDEENLPELILEAHNKIGNSEFRERQVYCRELWLNYLSYQGFYSQFHIKCNELLDNKQEIN